MDNLEHGSLKVEISKERNPTKISFNGKSDDRFPERILDKYFESIVPELSGDLTIEFLDLKFMNSSTVTSLVKLMRILEDREIHATFVYNENLKWQLPSFKALKTISRDSKYITVKGMTK